MNELVNLVKEWQNAEWIELAACKGSNVNFFPIDKRPNESFKQAAGRQRKKMEKALAICRTCPVIAYCERDHRHESQGVYFGTVPAERTARKQRAHPDCQCYACRSNRIYFKAKGRTR